MTARPRQGRRAATEEYRPYSYLGAQQQTRAMSSQFARVPGFDLQLDEDQTARVERLLTDSVVISAHDHAYVLPEDLGELRSYFSSGRLQTGYEGLAASHLTAVFDNMSGPLGAITSANGWKWTDVIQELGLRQADLAKQRVIRVARSVGDIHAAHRDGTTAIVFGLESATPIENELDRLDVLYGLGIRQIGVVYSESNALGSGLAEVRDGGLTNFGRRAIERMNALGLLIDVSHASDQTCLDAFDTSAQPVAITHAGARAIWPTPRMMPDEVLVACAQQGGVLGIEAAPHSTASRRYPKHSLESVMDHFTYCVELMGIDHVVFGPDTMWGDHVGLHCAYGWGPSSSVAELGFEPVTYVAGLDHPAEVFPSVVGWLVRAGYTDEDIRKVIGGNMLRVLDEVWADSP